MDRADRVVAGLARPEPTPCRRRGARYGRDRLLLRRGRRRVERLRRAVDNPTPTIVMLAALLALVVFALSRATWRPSTPFRLARRRAGVRSLPRLRMYGPATPPVRRHRDPGPADLGGHDPAPGGVPPRLEPPRDRDRGREPRAPRARGGRDRHRADAPRPRPRDGGDGAGARELDAGRTIGPLHAYRMAIDSDPPAAGSARDRRGRDLAAPERSSSCRSRSGWRSAGR